MKKIKVMSVFGTRPEAIKMCPLLKEIEQRENMESILCVTGQHREMLWQVLDAFEMKPDYDLEIMKANQTITDITTEVLEKLEPILQKEKPDLLLVHGDTTTSLSGALAAFYQQIPVGHVEAGLRTYDNYSPFPEEMNRRLIDQISTLFFAPTESNKSNLLKENCPADRIYVTGNTAIDAFQYTIRDSYEFHDEVLREDLVKKERASIENTSIDNSSIKDGSPLILFTAHRRENLGRPLENIYRAVSKIATDYPKCEIVCPLHLNPKVRTVAKEMLGAYKNIHLIEPLDVLDMHNLMAKCNLILTDSGGLQEEGPHLGIPVVVLRNETERPEAVEAGTVVVAGTEEEEIYRIVSTLLEDEAAYQKMAKAINPYGDGHASERICDAIEKWACEK